jgi:hypothetical protein
VAIPFDTLDYARKLETAGVPVEQAELQASALGEALAKAVATPHDLAALENRLDAKIDRVDAKIDLLSVKIESVRQELKLELGGRIDRLGGAFDTMKWMFGFVAALNIGMLVKLLLNH